MATSIIIDNYVKTTFFRSKQPLPMTLLLILFRDFRFQIPPKNGIPKKFRVCDCICWKMKLKFPTILSIVVHSSPGLIYIGYDL